MQLRPVTYRECVTLTLIVRREKIAGLESATGETGIAGLWPSAIGADQKVFSSRRRPISPRLEKSTLRRGNCISNSQSRQDENFL